MADRYETDVAWPLPQEPSAAEKAAFATSRKYRNVGPGHNKLEAVAEALVPKEPWEYGLMAALPGAGLAGKALAKLPAGIKTALLAAGIGTTATEAEAGKFGLSEAAAKKLLLRLGYDPKTTPGDWMVRHQGGSAQLADVTADKGKGGFHGFSALQTGLPINEMSFNIKGAKPLERPIKDIADYQGDELLFGAVDRMRGGGKLTGAGGRQFETAVPLEAGVDYPFMHANKTIGGDQRLFASAPGPVTKILNEAGEIAERGKKPIFAPVLMSKGAGDSSKQMARTAYQAVSQAGIGNDTAAAIDKAMAQMSKDVKGAPVRPYPGAASPDLPKWLEDVSPPHRSAFVSALDVRSVRDRTGVDIGELRYANTDPRARTAPTGSAGLMMGEMLPGAGTAPSLHSNYSTAFKTPAGGAASLQGAVPFHLIGPDVHRALLKAGPEQRFANMPAYYAMQSMPKGVPKSQPVTQEVVDLVSEFFRRNPSGWATAGAAPLAGISAYQPQGVQSQ